MTIACKNLICNMFRKVVFDPLTETEAQKWKDGISRARNPLLRKASDSICRHTRFGWSRKSWKAMIRRSFNFKTQGEIQFPRRQNDNTCPEGTCWLQVQQGGPWGLDPDLRRLGGKETASPVAGVPIGHGMSGWGLGPCWEPFLHYK